VQGLLKNNATPRLAATLRIAALLGVAFMVDAQLQAVDTEGETAGSSDGLIQRVVAQTTRSGITLRATRELRAGTLTGKHTGWMTVDTSVAPGDAFSYQVLEEGGSERTRETIFHALLKNEQETWRDRAGDGAALTLTNYEWTPLPDTHAGQPQLRLKPRRSDPRLIDGVLTVTRDGYPVRLEGKLAKSPSFWVKAVTVVRHYQRFGGVALPASIETLADLKLFGRASFTMRYHYREVNSQTVTHAVASAPFVGPTAEILALHSASSN